MLNNDEFDEKKAALFLRVNISEIKSAMVALGFPSGLPLSRTDVDEIGTYLKAAHSSVDHSSSANRWRRKAEAIVNSPKWHSNVRLQRTRIGLPAEGISEDQARKLHDKWVKAWWDMSVAKKLANSVHMTLNSPCFGKGLSA